MNNPGSPFRPLDASRLEIRLLRVISNIDHDEKSVANCTLETFSFQQGVPDFTALSYVWGDPDLTETVVVNGISKIAVSKVLHTALQWLPSVWRGAFPDRDGDGFWLWVSVFGPLGSPAPFPASVPDMKAHVSSLLL
jgi:hypothetical protein